jgi:putative hydrolase of the HAD superfamily
MSAPTWIFDLDDTLHQASLGIFAHISRMMNLYMERHLDMTAEEARQLRLHYWHRYGATLQGLMRHHDVDAGHFLQETHLLDELYRWLVWEPHWLPPCARCLAARLCCPTARNTI